MRRDELFAGSESSRAASPISGSEQSHGHVRGHASRPIDYGFEYDIIDTTTRSSKTSREPETAAAIPPPADNGRTHQDENAMSIARIEADIEEDDGLDFRLFATAKSTLPNLDAAQTEKAPAGSGIKRIRIRSPTPIIGADGEGSFINPHRRRGYYFTFNPDGDIGKDTRKTSKDSVIQFQDAALSGKDVQSLAKIKWYGTHLSWRVLNISSLRQNLPPSDLSPTSSSPTDLPNKQHRIRPNKKRRILLRRRNLSRLESEKAEREKKTRMNREKQQKKRAREKAKKAHEKGVDVDMGDSNELKETATVS